MVRGDQTSARLRVLRSFQRALECGWDAMRHQADAWSHPKTSARQAAGGAMKKYTCMPSPPQEVAGRSKRIVVDVVVISDSP
jgi:hypothetical protein